MQLTLLKGKIHRATVTHAELHYEGSCAIDVAACSTSPASVNTSASTSTTSPVASASPPMRSAARKAVADPVNGAAAHKSQVGNLVIICAYVQCDEAEVAAHKPVCVYVDRENRPTHTNHSMPK